MIYPSFVDNQTFFSMDSSRTEMEQIVAMSGNLKKIHLLTTRSYDNFDQLILEYIKTGLEIFGMKIGIVSHIKDDNYTICNVISPGDVLNKDDVFPLDGTYCREVYHSQKVLGFPCVGQLAEMKDHPVYVNMKLESYLSAPIYVYDELYGTLNFTSTEIRKHGFSEHERDLVALMANSIGNFVELSQKENDLKQANDRLKRLVGYVAHDLRNPLGVIKGISPFITDSDEEERREMAEMIETSAGRAIEMIHSILESAAMGTGKIDLELNSVNLSAMLKVMSRSFRKLISQKNLSLNLVCEKDLLVQVDPHRIEQVFTNLFSNAAKYSPRDESININALKDEKGMIEISFINSIDPELHRNKKFDVTQSVGFGQEIVREILRLHGTKLDLDVCDDKYKASFQLESIPNEEVTN